MRKPELDFLRETPRLPKAAWLLLAVGIALGAAEAWRYLKAEQSLAGERAIAASLETARAAKKPVKAIMPQQAAAETADHTQLELPWDTLFGRLEQSRPDAIALLSLEADGRKRDASLTAEARNPGVMLDYIERLRSQPGLNAVVLSSHTVRVEDPQQPLRFVVRLRWGT
jgi:hypothetical protein